MIVACQSCQSTFELDSGLLKATGSLVRCSKCRSVFRVYPPNAADRRMYTRTKTRNLIAHISVDQKGRLVSRGLSKTLDISRGGMLLETPHPVEPGQLSLMAVDADNNLIEIKGELVYCKRSAAGMYHSGVKFIGSEKEVANFVTRLIKEYNHRKNNLFIAQAE